MVCALDIAALGYTVFSPSYSTHNMCTYSINQFLYICGQKWVAVLHVEQQARACHIHTECICTTLSLRSLLLCVDMTCVSRNHLKLHALKNLHTQNAQYTSADMSYEVHQ